MYGKIKNHLQAELDQIREAGLFKEERIITSPQDAEITLPGETNNEKKNKRNGMRWLWE